MGRAGRDGAAVEASLLVSEEDALYAAALGDPVERRRYEQMLRYSRETRCCRRRMLLGFIGQSVGFCAGCDVCETARAADPAGSTRAPGALPEGQAEILAVARRHNRRLTLRELSLLLSGGLGHETAAGGLDRLAGFGILVRWEPEDIETALETLRLAGQLRFGRWPWRDRVVVGGGFPGEGAALPREESAPR